MSGEQATALQGLAAVPIGQLRPSPNNPRENLDGIDELAVSIRENGLIQPIVAQRIPDHTSLQIVAGHRRFAAILRLGWTKVPVVIRRDMLPDEELLAMLVENGQRANLDPIEEAHALDRLRLNGVSKTDIARRVGRSVAWLESRFLLLELPEEDQEEVRAGHYSLTYAHELVRKQRAEEREAVAPAPPKPVGRPKGRKTTPYFSDKHPLSATVRAICNHRGTPKVGKVGCGRCWEDAVRADALRVAGIAEPSRAEPSRAEPSRAEPSRAEPSRARSRRRAPCTRRRPERPHDQGRPHRDRAPRTCPRMVAQRDHRSHRDHQARALPRGGV